MTSRGRTLSAFLAAVLIAGAVLAPLRSAETPSPHTPHHTEGTPVLPGSPFLEQLAETAEKYRKLAPGFSADAFVRRTRPGTNTRPNASVGESNVFVLDLGGEPDPSGGYPLEIPSGKKRPAPTMLEWTQLFSEQNQPLVTLIDQGEVPYFGRQARRISFRGSVPFTDGKDVREWEGYVYLDPITLAPLEIIAVPLNQHEKMTVRLERYRKSWKIGLFVVGFRTRKKPKGQIYRLSFVPEREGMTVPIEERHQTFRWDTHGTVHKRRETVTEFRNYTFDLSQVQSEQ